MKHFYYPLISLWTSNIFFSFLYHIENGISSFSFIIPVTWFLHNLDTTLASKRIILRCSFDSSNFIENLWENGRDLEHPQELCYVSSSFKRVVWKLEFFTICDSSQSTCANMLLFNPQFIFFLKRILQYLCEFHIYKLSWFKISFTIMDRDEIKTINKF